MQARPFRSLLYPLCMALCAAMFALATPALAQSDHMSSAAQSSASQVRKIEAKMQKLGMQLQAIERKTIAADSKLQAQRRRFSAHMLKAMKTLGYDPGADSKQLAAIKHKVLSGKLKPNERQAEIKKFQRVRAHLMQGQVAAMQDKGLQKESEALNKATMLAMKKHDPKTASLMKQFNALGAKLRHMRQAAKAHH